MAMISTFPVSARLDTDVVQTASGPAEHAVPSLVISESLFRSALIRERKRADRTSETFLLVVVSFPESLVDSSTWADVIEALCASKRTSDVLGWFSAQTSLGVILAGVSACECVKAPQLEARFRQELSLRLDPAAATRLSLQVHAHLPGSAPPERVATEFSPLEPVLARLTPRSARAALTHGIKRSLDIVGSAAMLIVLSPVLLLIAALIKLTSRGPVLFKQIRIGQQARPFTMLKFRSMHTGVDHAIHHDFVTKFITASNSINEPVKDARFKIAHDPRITTIGRFLRKTSLDEVPQFWNVLIGEMSLVGPRPPLQYEVDKYQPWHCRRVLDAKPGITGLWQVNGRSRTTFDEMVRLDLKYARTHSFWTDIKILLATPGAVISGKGAA